MKLPIFFSSCTQGNPLNFKSERSELPALRDLEVTGMPIFEVHRCQETIASGLHLLQKIEIKALRLVLTISPVATHDAAIPGS